MGEAGPSDLGAPWQSPAFALPAFLAENPSLADFIRGWAEARGGSGQPKGEPVGPDWTLSRGALREQLRKEAARSDWLFQRGHQAPPHILTP